MTVNSLLKAALEPVAPVEADTYEGTEPDLYHVRVHIHPDRFRRRRAGA